MKIAMMKICLITVVLVYGYGLCGFAIENQEADEKSVDISVANIAATIEDIDSVNVTYQPVIAKSLQSVQALQQQVQKMLDSLSGYNQKEMGAVQEIIDQIRSAIEPFQQRAEQKNVQ